MKLDRDISILTHIVDYCDQIKATIERFGEDRTVFASDAIYRNAVALCILQIGELVDKRHSDSRTKSAEIPWPTIKAKRNIVANRYGTVDAEVTWEIITEDIPVLKSYCSQMIGESNTTE